MRESQTPESAKACSRQFRKLYGELSVSFQVVESWLSYRMQDGRAARRSMKSTAALDSRDDGGNWPELALVFWAPALRLFRSTRESSPALHFTPTSFQPTPQTNARLRRGTRGGATGNGR